MKKTMVNRGLEWQVKFLFGDRSGLGDQDSASKWQNISEYHRTRRCQNNILDGR